MSRHLDCSRHSFYIYLGNTFILVASLLQFTYARITKAKKRRRACLLMSKIDILKRRHAFHASGDFRSRDSTREFRQKRHPESFLFRLSTTHLAVCIQRVIAFSEFRPAFVTGLC